MDKDNGKDTDNDKHKNSPMNKALARRRAKVKMSLDIGPIQ